MKISFVTNYYEKPLWNDKERAEAVDKMFAVAQDTNLCFIVDTTNKVIEDDKKRGIANLPDYALVNAYEIGEIRCYEDSAIDEFDFADDEGQIIKPFSYEVVTEQVAISNEQEWLNDSNYTDEDRESYVLGEVMSDYYKLPNLSPNGIQYYVRLM